MMDGCCLCGYHDKNQFAGLSLMVESRTLTLSVLRYANIFYLFFFGIQEELDLKVLVFQNKKLAERIEQRKKAETELRKRIEQLENRQRTDDAVLMIVNRYWNQVSFTTLKLYNLYCVSNVMIAFILYHFICISHC